MSYNLTFSFTTLQELNEFIEDQNSIEHMKQKKSKKTVDDKRGSKTKDLHQKAKQYQSENDNIPYKEALREVGRLIKESKMKTPEEII